MASEEAATTLVVDMLTELKTRLEQLDIDRDTMDLLQEIQLFAGDAEEGRLLAQKVLLRGRISLWRKRKIQDFGRDHGCEVIDLDEYRSRRNPNTAA